MSDLGLHMAGAALAHQDPATHLTQAIVKSFSASTPTQMTVTIDGGANEIILPALALAPVGAQVWVLGKGPRAVIIGPGQPIPLAFTNLHANLSSVVGTAIVAAKLVTVQVTFVANASGIPLTQHVARIATRTPAASISLSSWQASGAHIPTYLWSTGDFGSWSNSWPASGTFSFSATFITV